MQLLAFKTWKDAASYFQECSGILRLVCCCCCCFSNSNKNIHLWQTVFWYQLYKGDPRVMRSYPRKLILPVMNHKVYEARCSSNVNQCSFSDLNRVVLTCAGRRFVSFLMSFPICCFPLLDGLVMKVYWPHHATSNFCPCSSFFGLPGSVLIPEMQCQTHISSKKKISGWRNNAQSLFWPCVRILLVLKKHCLARWDTIVTTCDSTSNMFWAADDNL